MPAAALRGRIRCRHRLRTQESPPVPAVASLAGIAFGRRSLPLFRRSHRLPASPSDAGVSPCSGGRIACRHRLRTQESHPVPAVASPAGIAAGRRSLTPVPAAASPAGIAAGRSAPHPCSHAGRSLTATIPAVGPVAQRLVQGTHRQWCLRAETREVDGMNSGEPSSLAERAHGNPEPSRRYTGGRCRDYLGAGALRHAETPFMTGSSIPHPPALRKVRG